ncbi:MAG: hypothetical protein LBJ75_01005 [Puniceicoccales bacterium]|jgi:hypothetical protein|nr:hypothetical protein [Puniceicoccales bacterium]
MLNNFSKNNVGIKCKEDVKNCILRGNDINGIYIKQTSDEFVFVLCAVNGVGIADVDVAFCKYLLEENSYNDCDISPLYWGMYTDQNVISDGDLSVLADKI